MLRIITFFASLITVSIGFYDLYKHFPMFSVLLNDYMSGLTSWLEEMIALRMTLLISYIIYYSEPVHAWCAFFFSSQWTMFEGFFFPVIYLFKCIKGILIIFYELFLPLYALICLMFRSGWNLIVTILTLPFMCLSVLTSFISESTMALLAIFYSL